MIVDASVAFKWIVDEVMSDQAESLIDGRELIAPSILLAEVGHGLSKRIRRGEMSPVGLMEKLQRLPLLLTLEPSDMDIGAAWTLAMDLNHSFYDCLYLAMAIRLDDKLVTADEIFARKCSVGAVSSRVRLLESFDS